MELLGTKIKMTSRFGIPAAGFGTWQSEPEKTAASVCKAIECGFRHIDTAALYGNEAEVGDGVRLGLEKTGFAREDIFITTTVWKTDRVHGRTLRAFE